MAEVTWLLGKVTIAFMQIIEKLTQTNYRRLIVKLLNPAVFLILIILKSDLL